MKQEIEIMRHNVTPSQFLAYVRSQLKRKGLRDISGDLNLKYFEAGNDLEFDYHDIPGRPCRAEKSVSKPYEMQTYVMQWDGSIYNEICEFEFDDEKTGHGYYYLYNMIVEAVEQPVEAEEVEAQEQITEAAEAQEQPEQMKEEKNMEKRYLNNWSYNCARLLDAMRVIIENNGGRVKEYPKYEIINRTVNGLIVDCYNKIRALEHANEEHGRNDKRDQALQEYRNKLEEAQNFDNTPLVLSIYHQITFILDNVFYEYVLDDNPFFDFYLLKTPVVNNERCVCLAETIEDKSWLFDSFFRFSCSNDDIKEAANMIFNALVKHPMCEVDRERTRERVPNTYNDGWHWEVVTKPVQKRKIDF